MFEGTVPLAHYSTLSAVLFVIGIVGVLVRRNVIVVFMSIEIMLNAVNISLIAFDHYLNCLLYTSPSPRDKRQSRMPSSA